MKYLVNPNNRSNNFEPLRDMCVKTCNIDNCSKNCIILIECPKNCNTRCNPRCETYCRIDGCYCKVGNGRNEINSTGSFM